jgi:hypothetical protein
MRVISLAAALVLLAASAAMAQPPAAGQPVTIAVSIQRAYTGIKTNLTQAADKMPEADYGFKPSSMPEMRTYGALFSHIAQSQFGTCAGVKGVANPMMGRQLETELKTKAEIVKALADSFAFCDDAYSSLSDGNVSEMISGRGGQTARAALLANNVTHNNEMAGTAYVYLRAKNIVPPSTENAMAARGGGGARGGAPGGRGAGAPPGR